MPSLENFPDIPPFPDDIVTAPLFRLSLEKLLNHDNDEVKRFCTACEDLGFFYLDFRGTTQGDAILAQADELFGVGERLFELDLEEKKKYDFGKKNSYFGYKATGSNVVDRDGNRDRNEFYNVSKDDILDVADHWPAPELLHESRPLLKSFMTSAHSTITLILNLLNEHLQLPASTLANMHRLGHATGDQVRFIKAPPQPVDDRRVALGQHTDFGSVTILFNRVGGLQILPPGKDSEWCYVRPLPGHAIINLGDAMVKFTNGLLRSNIHRVMSPPGAQADITRYSLVYFSRPEEDVLLKRLEGSPRIPPLPKGVVEEDIKSKDWIIRRGLGNRVDLHKQIDYEKSRGTELQSQRLDA
ncbi:1-aminocyclopropane-1-carboxylic acid oxidase [Coccidioides immitis H538.4]|uniref:1-aminocyclopropane-1-carboxylic acid oxidase n=1 Tax=Coccidioides immitis H538.4 TaxID=396776 RepID=A0A0J8RWM0_COCIT|nr:1-aminocyclopropane-1-carboxylic acid oxidase [Coccidioides immitis H538.4]